MPVTYDQAVANYQKRKEMEYHTIVEAIDQVLTHDFTPGESGRITVGSWLWGRWKEQIKAAYPDWCFTWNKARPEENRLIIYFSAYREKPAPLGIDTDSTNSVQSTNSILAEVIEVTD